MYLSIFSFCICSLHSCIMTLRSLHFFKSSFVSSPFLPLSLPPSIKVGIFQNPITGMYALQSIQSYPCETLLFLVPQVVQATRHDTYGFVKQVPFSLILFLPPSRLLPLPLSLSLHSPSLLLSLPACLFLFLSYSPSILLSFSHTPPLSFSLSLLLPSLFLSPHVSFYRTPPLSFSLSLLPPLILSFSPTPPLCFPLHISCITLLF